MDYFRRFTFLFAAPVFEADDLEGLRFNQIVAEIERSGFEVVRARKLEDAEIAVQTAQAKLAQVSRKPLQSEMQAAEHQVSEAKAQVSQIEAEQKLAARDLDRGREMYRQGLMARSEFDKVVSNQRSLTSKLTSAQPRRAP